MTWPTPKFILKAPLLFLNLALVLSAATHITTSSLPAATVGQPYSVSLTASGAAGPFNWSVSGGNLPGGISLSSAGLMSGSPVSSGTFNFTVKATSTAKGNDVDTQPLSIIVAPALSITTSSLAAGQVGINYSQTLLASGGTPPYSWSISTGSMPAGLSLSAGRISGTPTAAGTANFTIKVVDANTIAATQQLSLAVAPAPISITTTSLPGGQVGVFYSQSLQASGGTGNYGWSITAGSLPAGLSLSFLGQISGRPTTTGPANLTVKVSDTAGGSATRAISMNITSGPLSIITSALPQGQAGISYSQTLQASGGTAPYTWAIRSGSLPSGLSLTAAGQISGTPSAASVSSFSVGVSDNAGGSQSAAFTITVAASLSSGGCPAGTGTVGHFYSATLSASGGTPAYNWTIASGQLPSGVSLNNTTGQISGIPGASGSFNFALKVSDQNSASVISNCTLVVSLSVPALIISTASLPDGVIGSSYSQVLSATGGQPPYAWSVSAGAIPAGLTMNGPQIGGTPTSGGTFPFTVLVSDGSGKSITKDFSIRVSAPLTITTGSLSALKTSTAAAQQLSASGGVPPYTWTLSGGALPPGLVLSAGGSINGTPTAPGNYNFTARVSDSAGASADRMFALTITTSLGITSCPAANATQGQPYSSAAGAAGGQTPYTWSLASGTLPAGLLFNTSSGALSGNPSESASYIFTLLLTDKLGATATRDCQLVVASRLMIGTVALPDAPQSAPYAQTLQASGGKAPYTWAIVSGNLPIGLTFSSSGAISGTAIPSGSFSFTVGVTDGNGASAQQALSLKVISGLNLSSCPGITGEVGLLFDSPIPAYGGSPPYRWSLAAGALPSGLVLTPQSGEISGTPAQSGTSQFTVNVTDSIGHVSTRSCSTDVVEAVNISTSSFHTGTTNSSYSDTLSTTGGIAPYTWATTAGALPPGLSLNPASGHITGTPLVTGTFSFTAKVVDGLGGQAMKDLAVSISQGLTIPDCPSPAGSVGISYSALLTAVGGSAPYQWKIDSGALPPGLVLNSDNATISGTPNQPGLSAYVLRVDDASAKSTVRLCSIQVNPPQLTITSSAALPKGLLGTAYSQMLTAVGGHGPYSWSVTTTGAPGGLSLDPTGSLTGVPTAAGTFSFTIQVTDQDNNSARQLVTLAILAGNPPNVTISGLPDIVEPAQQPSFTLQLDSGYPADINGTVALVFTPDPAVGLDDPAVMFANSARVLQFTVPAHSTQIVWSTPVVAFQSGTVAGTIQLNVKLESNGSDITPPASSLSIRVDRLAPRIVKVQVVPTASGVEVHVTGFATTREVTQGTFHFSGTSLSPIDIPVPLSNTSSEWFQSSDSAPFGGQFGLIQSFLWQGQPAGTLNTVSVSLTNSQGASAAASATF